MENHLRIATVECNETDLFRKRQRLKKTQHVVVVIVVVGIVVGIAVGTVVGIVQGDPSDCVFWFLSDSH